jgi:sucrose-6-phosphate hydrolase SacC (GH32 family)
MLFPCELTLRTTEDGIRMFAEPAKEIELLHGPKYSWHDETLKPDSNLLADISGELFHLRGQFEAVKASGLELALRGVPIAYDVGRQELSCKGKTAPLKPVNGTIRLEILVDRTSIEIFGNDGRIYMPIGAIPADSDKSLRLVVRSGNARIQSLRFTKHSAWEQPPPGSSGNSHDRR